MTTLLTHLPFIDRTHVPFLRAVAAADTGESGHDRHGADRDDLPKLVYADRLDEWGHHQRADLIRCQVWLTRNAAGHDRYCGHSLERAVTDPDHPNYGTPAAARERELLSPPKGEWEDRMFALMGWDDAITRTVPRPPLAARGDARRHHVHFAQGFSHSGTVTWPAGWSLAQVAALFARQPVKGVDLRIDIPGGRREWYVHPECSPDGMERGLLPDDLFALVEAMAPPKTRRVNGGRGPGLVFATRTIAHKLIRQACRDATRVIREAVWGEVERGTDT